MKKIIYAALFAAFAIFYMKAQQDQKIHGVTVGIEKIDQLKGMVKVLQHQTKKLCDLCKIGKDPRFMRMEPKEFDYRFNKSAGDIEGTINNIASFYRSIGVDQSIIDQETAALRAPIYELKA